MFPRQPFTQCINVYVARTHAACCRHLLTSRFVWFSCNRRAFYYQHENSSCGRLRTCSEERANFRRICKGTMRNSGFCPHKGHEKQTYSYFLSERGANGVIYCWKGWFWKIFDRFAEVCGLEVYWAIAWTVTYRVNQLERRRNAELQQYFKIPTSAIDSRVVGISTKVHPNQCILQRNSCNWWPTVYLLWTFKTTPAYKQLG